jgi:hypothetical protein
LKDQPWRHPSGLCAKPKRCTAHYRKVSAIGHFFYTPVYVLWDAIEAVRALPKCTGEAVEPIIFTPEVDAALAALVGARKDAVHPVSHFPGPEAHFYHIVTMMRSKVLHGK